MTMLDKNEELKKENKLIGKRLKQLRNKLNLTQTKFGEELNKSLSAIQQYELGTRRIDESTALLMQLKFNINKSWLKSGEGDMFQINAHGNSIPLYKTEHLSTYTYNDSLDFLRPEYRTGDIFIVLLADNSMFPLLRNGDMVVCKKVSDISEGLFFIKTNDMSVIRNISKDITLIPENPEFKSTVLSRDDIEILGQVVWYGRYL